MFSTIRKFNRAEKYTKTKRQIGFPRTRWIQIIQKKKMERNILFLFRNSVECFKGKDLQTRS